MKTYAIKASRFVLPGEVARGGWLVVEDGKIVGHVTEDPSCPVVDRDGMWVAPGFVDTHIHGFFNHATTDDDPVGMNELCAELVRYGTTSWLPTTFTAGIEAIGDSCAAIAGAAESRDASYVGTRIQGIFLEGPFFTSKHVGAQNPEFLVDPSYEAFAGWQERAHGLIRKSALAPERDGSCAYIARLDAEGVRTAIGHSDATYAQAVAAVDAGASVFVHTYNGMSGLHHREPGVVGCAMTTPQTFAEVIADGRHVMPAAVDALVRAKGWDHVVLITDCLGCGGMPEGEYMSGGMPVVMRDGACYLRGKDNLAGSVAKLVEVVKNVSDWGIVTAEQAIRMATEVAARSAGIDGACGSILPGRDADLVVLNPDLTLVETYLGGTRVAAPEVKA